MTDPVYRITKATFILRLLNTMEGSLTQSPDKNQVETNMQSDPESILSSNLIKSQCNKQFCISLPC